MASIPGSYKLSERERCGFAIAGFERWILGARIADRRAPRAVTHFFSAAVSSQQSFTPAWFSPAEAEKGRAVGIWSSATLDGRLIFFPPREAKTSKPRHPP